MYKVTAPQKPKRLMEQVRDKFRKLHYSYRTEQAYCDWIKRYIWFHKKRHPREMGAAEVEAFLSHLATDRGVSASTQNQALCALLFLYRKVLEVELDWVENITRAKPSEHVPIVLTRDEVATVLGRMSGRNWLMASLMYGTGMRLTECLRLRIQDVDFGYRQITVFNGKGAKDRVVPLPESLIPSLKEQIAESARVLEADPLGARAPPPGGGLVVCVSGVSRAPLPPPTSPWFHTPAGGRLRHSYRSGAVGHREDNASYTHVLQPGARVSQITSETAPSTLALPSAGSCSDASRPARRFLAHLASCRRTGRTASRVPARTPARWRRGWPS